MVLVGLLLFTWNVATLSLAPIYSPTAYFQVIAVANKPLNPSLMIVISTKR